MSNDTDVTLHENASGVYPDRRRRRLLQAGAVLPWVTLPIAAVGQTAPQLLSKPIPSSGERLPIVGIGTARRFDVGATVAERAPLEAVLRDLPKLGGKIVDTAPSYGTAEMVIGDLISQIGNRDQLFLATKVAAGRNGASAGIAEMETSFKRLRTSRVDLMLIHNMAGVEAMLPVLRDWKAAGKIRYLGMSTSFERQYDDFAAVMAREVLDFIQIDYAIDNRSAENRILPLAADRGMAVLTNLPFGRGRVFEVFKGKPIPDWAVALGIQSWAQFALKFVVSNPAVTAAIPGTARPAYLVDNLGAARAPLPDQATRRRMAEFVAAS